MGSWSQVTQESLDLVQVQAGMILTSFNTTTPTAPTAENVLCATTGGIQADCVPTFEDFGEDIDNCPANTKEMKRITGWDCTLSFTALDMSGEVFKMALGAAIKTAETTAHPEIVEPRAQVAVQDFTDLWFVSERIDEKIIAIQLKNALSTGGFSYKTQKNGKGQLTVTITGHVSIASQDEVPMNFFICSEEGYTPGP
jgi:hypothetical protein